MYADGNVLKVQIGTLSNPEQIRALPDAELLQLHHRLHQLYGAARARGEATEYPYVNVHIWTVEEMTRRGMQHHVVDALDQETARLEQRATPGWIETQLRQAEDAVLVPAYVSLVGSATRNATPHDVDVLIREDAEHLSTGWRESVMLLVRRLLDPAKSQGLTLHILGNPQGPHLPPGQGYIPLYDLVLRPRREAELVTKAASAMPDWERWLEQAPAGRRVDLGPGEDGPPAGFESLGRPHDLNETWPLPSNSVAVLRANHVLEHLREPTHAMTEAWRVLVPGGLLIVTVPEATAPGAVAHPEHRSFWNADSFRFWSDPALLRTIEDRVPQAFELLYLDIRHESGCRYVDAVLRKPDDGVAKRALTPITTFTPPKPAMKGRAHTDAFSPDEIWPWVAKHLAAGVVCEPKYNGFRAIVQHRHPRLSLRFEDSQQERADALLRADPRLEALHALPDCILDCDIGVIESGKRWPRPRLMALTADRPELPAGARIAITAFDVLYWNTESVNERPFRERRLLLEKIAPTLRQRGLDIPPEVMIRTKADLVRAWRSPRFGLADRSEGVVLKTLDWIYQPGLATDGTAKIKHAMEVKALVLEVKRTKGGGYNFRGGLLPGRMASALANLIEFRGQQYVDLGFSFNGAFAAQPGDIITAEVEEITWDQADRRLNWLGAKPLDIDRERNVPYAAAQVIDMARRARVLQEVPAAPEKAVAPAGEGGETRGEVALRHWEQHWYEAMPLSGRALPFILHAHWRGLTEAEAKLDMAALLQTDNSLHFDLRLGTDRFAGWWGITLFAGAAADNREELRIFRMMHDANEQIESAPKQFGPAAWLRVGLREPLVVEPGGVGATSRAYSKFFALDHGTWRLGMARQHAVEIWLEGRHLHGRFMWQYADDGTGRRFWLFTRPTDQRPYAATHARETVLRELARKEQRYLVWPRDPANLARGHDLLDVRHFGRYEILRAQSEQRYTLGVVYAPNQPDAHGDWATPETIERACWQFARLMRQGRVTVGLMHRPETEGAGEPVESYIYRGTGPIAGKHVPQGAWLLGVIWREDVWPLIKAGQMTGLSLQGTARLVQRLAQWWRPHV